MDSLITTTHLLRRQDANSLRMKNQQKDTLGHLTANMATLSAHPYIIIDGQNVYISATSSERILDTLEFFPHNFPMPQLSSTERLIMAANDMSNALKNPHPEVPFAQVRDDAREASQNFQKVQTPRLSNAPAKTAENKSPAKLSHPILTSPVQQRYQTGSQKIIKTEDTTKAQLLPRVVTPMTGRVAPPRVPMRSHNFSPRNLSQDNFWDM
jgi:hypothetical protein